MERPSDSTPVGTGIVYQGTGASHRPSVWDLVAMTVTEQDRLLVCYTTTGDVPNAGAPYVECARQSAGPHLESFRFARKGTP